MKKATKILIITASILTAVGLIVFLIGMSVLDWDFRRLDATDYTEMRYATTRDERVERVELNLITFPLVVTTGTETVLKYYESTNSDVKVEYVDGTLKVTEKYEYNPFKTGMFYNINRDMYKFVLSLPYNSDLIITGTNCDIYARSLDFKDININVTNLDLELRDCTADSLRIDATNAHVDLENCGISNVNIDATNADIDIVRGRYSTMLIDATNTHVDFDKVDAYSIELDATNGNYVLEDVTVDRLIASAINLNADLEIVGVKVEYTILTDGKGLPRPQTGTTDKLISLSGMNCDVDLDIRTFQ